MSSIGSITDESYLAALSQLQSIRNQQVNVSASVSTNGDTDSYISTISSEDEAIPSGIYNSSGLEVGADNGTSSEASGASGSGGAGGGSSDSDEETTTEIITINGVTYLQTTTTDENGNTTVTKTEIG
jgi:hypothetical protein